MKKLLVVPAVFWFFAGAVAAASDGVPAMPMPVVYQESAGYRWLSKPVLASRLLDSMEDIATWSLKGEGELTLAAERFKDGSHSLRLRARTKPDKPGPMKGRPFGLVTAVRKFAGENWSDYNRVSFWVYPELPGFRAGCYLGLVLFNEGKERSPAGYGHEGFNYVLLQSGRWQHVVWEIPHLGRDKVTALEIRYRQQGNEPEAGDTVSFDIDHLELQRVEPDHYEGWNVAPGRISFSHTGYPVGSAKTAIASDMKSGKFEVIRQETGETALSKEVRSAQTRLGRFQVLDFSELREPGTYMIRAGDRNTPPFRIDDNPWRDTIWKVINFFYVLRCGDDIPGSHRICHRDWQGTHNGETIGINGGWHDAGDLSQASSNTAEAVHAMMSLAERLRATGRDRELSARLIKEARWGLDWLLKTNFGDGYRITWATMDFWTNGVIGDMDDVSFEATNNAWDNFFASSAEAIAARVLESEDPDRAQYSLRTAKRDWQFAVEKTDVPDKRVSVLEVASAGALASLELFRATGEAKYADKAAELAQVIVNSQRRTFVPDWEVPLAGFFYTGPDHRRMLHFLHRGYEQAPIVVLSDLCNSFPEHKDWMKWYSAVALHSEYYLKRLAQFSEPYGMMPNGVYADDEYQQAPKDRSEAYRAQVLKGIAIGPHHYLRIFPVWFDFTGNNAVILAQAKALAAAAHLRFDQAGADLAQKQLEWIVGRNPFSSSVMYGEGHDYHPQYAISGDIVGSLPVGIHTRGANDLPYWPGSNCFAYKEVWVHPAARWLWLMRDLAGPATVNGKVHIAGGQTIRFKDQASGHVTEAKPDFVSGDFQTRLPQGAYSVTTGDLARTITVLPGGVYNLDLRKGRAIGIRLSSETSAAGQVMLTLTAEGSGRHKIALRTDNLGPLQPPRDIELKPGSPETISWKLKMDSLDGPWFAVVLPDNIWADRYEATGGVRGGAR